MAIRKGIFPRAWACMIGLFFVASAMAKPNFSGTWIRDNGDSDAWTAVVIPILDQKKDAPDKNFTLRINHRDKHLQVAVKQDNKKPVVADYNLGRGWHGSVAGRLNYGGMRYRAQWKNDNLVINKNAGYRGEFGLTGGNMEQRWILSPGGNVLTIITTIRQLTTKEVFKRK